MARKRFFQTNVALGRHWRGVARRLRRAAPLLSLEHAPVSARSIDIRRDVGGGRRSRTGARRIWTLVLPLSRTPDILP